MNKFLLFFSVFLTCTTLFAQKTWTGATSNDWAEASNWQPAGMPSGSDDIVIPADVPNNAVVLTGASVSFRTVVINASANLTVNSGAFVTSNSSAGVVLRVIGSFTNHGTVNLVSSTDGGVGSVITVDQLGIFNNQSDGRILITGINSLHAQKYLLNYGFIDCVGNAVITGLFNQQCATLNIHGSATIYSRLFEGISSNSGSLYVSEVLQLEGLQFRLLGILTCNNIINADIIRRNYSLRTRGPSLVRRRKVGSLIITDIPQLTIDRMHAFGGFTGVYLDQAGTQPAGFMSGDIFQPDPSLPIGSHTLYLEITRGATYDEGDEIIDDDEDQVSENGRAAASNTVDPEVTGCHYLVPFTYVMLAAPGIWLGNFDAEWELSDNWADGVVPGPTTNVVIPSGTPYAPVIYTKTATANNISIAAGTTLTLSENAILDIKGNIIGSGTFVANALEANVTFSGLSSQIIPGGNYYDVSISGGIGKTIGGDVTVGNLFTFSGSTKILLGDHNLTIGSYARINGYDAENHFVTNGTGGLKKDDINDTYSVNFIFPIGSEDSYSPIAIYNYGTEDNFTARVTDGAYTSYMNEEGQGDWIRDKVVNKTWFISEQVPGGSNVLLTLSWNRSDEMGSFDREQSLVSHYKNGKWEQNTPFSSFEIDLYSVVLAGVSSFSPFAVSNLGSALPVTLTRFDAVREANAALLSWSTTEETNSDRFEVERSINGKSWQKIGTVKSGGESKVLAGYHFVDLRPMSAQENLYRLKMIDMDGTFTYSRIRNLKFDGTNNSVVYPNPVSDKLFVRDFTHVLNVRILDLKGNVVHHTDKVGNDGVVVSKLPAGMHIVEIKWLDGRKTKQKIIVTR